MEEGVDWSQLPEELLNSISKNLTVYSDFLRFRCVCRSWLSSAGKTPTNLPPQLPWLLLPNSLRRSRSGRALAAAFLDISGDKLRLLHLPEASRAATRCRGSSHGWLVVLDESPAIIVVNILTRSKLNLPPLFTFPNVIRFSYSDVGREFSLRGTSTGENYSLSLRQIRDTFVKKIVLSLSPLDGLFVAVAILNQSGELAYAKHGDLSWRFVESARSYSEDVVFASGEIFYAVGKRGSVALCDVSGESPMVSIVETPRLVGADMHYLVISGDDLLLISRYLDLDRDDLEEHYRTLRFEVFRMIWGVAKWEKVEDLGDRMLFIGQNSSAAFSAGDFPGCCGNCIYFTDDYSELNYESVLGECDCGIFRLCDGIVERQWNSRTSGDHWPTPIWVSPNP